MAGKRHPILFDVKPWRRVRLGMLAAMAVMFAIGGVLRVIHQDGLALLMNLCAIIFGFGILYMFVRAHTSFIRATDDGVMVRRLRSTMWVEPESVRAVRVGSLGEFYKASGMRARLPRPAGDWTGLPALGIRVDSDTAFDARGNKAVGERSVCGADLVFPVATADSLREEMITAFGERILPAPGRAKKRKGRR